MLQAVRHHEVSSQSGERVLASANPREASEEFPILVVQSEIRGINGWNVRLSSLTWNIPFEISEFRPPDKQLLVPQAGYVIVTEIVEQCKCIVILTGRRGRQSTNGLRPSDSGSENQAWCNQPQFGILTWLQGVGYR